MFTPSQIALVARNASAVEEGTGGGMTAYASNVMRRRYIVGGVTNALVFPIGESRHAIRSGIRRMLDTPYGWGADVPATLGMWEDDGSVYVDLGDMWHSLDVALGVAARRGELAIYDRETGKCIYLQCPTPVACEDGCDHTTP